MSLSIDFETRSMVDLRKAGVHRYAVDPSTDVWCMAYAFDDEEPAIVHFRPEVVGAGTTLPERVVEYVLEGGEIRAWNAQFERLIWQCLGPKYLWPTVLPTQWVCTAAEAAAMALPRSLDQCAKVMGVTQQKDTSGYALMLRMSRPRKVVDGVPIWWDEVDRRARLGAYCQQDVRTERALARALRRLPPAERTLYLLDQTINDRGVQLDRALIEAAKDVAQEGLARANDVIAELTNGDVRAVTQVGQIKTWLQGRDVAVEGLAKKDVALLLESDLDPTVRDVIEARAEAGRSSVAKLDAMLTVAGADDRARGLFLYHGANTGRWSGRLVQPQNFPRGDVPDAETYIPDVLAGRYDLLDLHAPPLAIVSSLLRPMLIASLGHRLIAGDYSAIEARVLNWMAGQRDVVQRFADGHDVYVDNAMRIFRIPREAVKKFPHRQTGKFQELGCGYGMGATKAVSAAKDVYQVTLSEEDAIRIVADYRDSHDKVVEWWWALQDAAMDAVKAPGSSQTVNPNGAPVTFTMRGKYLWLVLPSKRALAYAQPRIKDRETPWGDTRPAVCAWQVDSKTKQWSERGYYGGLWAENIVQAVSRDLLADAMVRVEQAGYPIVMHAHDEIVADVPTTHGSVAEFTNLMTTLPSWAAGCPVAVEAWEGARYRK